MKSNDKTLTFKTNINCSGCVAEVTPFLNDADGICHWDVNTENKDKILSVHSEGITEQEVIQKVQEAGFKIELLNQ
ncbi:MAG: heavy-metal-associated domain-containing protein [Chitinophagales bacterium]